MGKFGINESRFYRLWTKGASFVSFEAKIKETDLYISACLDLSEQAIASIKRHRGPVEDYVRLHPDFQKTLVPYPLSPKMSPIIKTMVLSTKKAGVGPMAAVAGAIAEYVGRDLLKECDEVIVENGGDIFVSVKRPIKIGIYAGDSPYTGKLCLDVAPDEGPLGICASSGTWAVS